MTKFKKPVALTLILVLLAALAWWDESETKNQENQDKLKNRVLTFKPDQVKKIEFFSPRKNQKFVLQKSEAHLWSITKPISAKADQDKIVSFLKNLSEYQYERKIDKSQIDPKDYGLEIPSSKIILSLENENEMNLQVGDKTPVGYSSYIKTSKSEAVYLGSQFITTLANKSLFDLRSKKFIQSDLNGISSLDYQSAKTNLTFKLENGVWNWDEGDKLSQNAVNNFIDFIKRIQVKEFIDNPSTQLKAAIDPKNPATMLIANITTQSAGGRQEFAIFQNADQLYGKLNDSGTLSKIETKDKENLNLIKDDFINKDIFSFDSREVIELSINDQTWRRTDSKWQSDRTESDNKNILKNLNVPSFLADLEFATANRTIKKNESSPGKLLLQFTIKASEYEIKAKIFADKSNPEKIIIEHSQSEKSFQTNKSLISPIQIPKSS